MRVQITPGLQTKQNVLGLKAHQATLPTFQQNHPGPRQTPPHSSIPICAKYAGLPSSQWPMASLSQSIAGRQHDEVDPGRVVLLCGAGGRLGCSDLGALFFGERPGNPPFSYALTAASTSDGLNSMACGLLCAEYSRRRRTVHSIAACQPVSQTQWIQQGGTNYL